MAALRARLGDAVAKLVLVPVVVSLCGAMTLILGLQWVEALQRQRQVIEWRTRLWTMLLALLQAMLPAKRLEASGGEGYSSRPLKRQSDTSRTRSPTKRARRRVLIWDLDETLVLFASLYTGTFAQTHGKEVAPGVALGEQMMTFLLAMLEKHFFFSDLHDTDVDHIAHRYERIREIYERRGHVDFLHDTNSEWFAIHGALVAAIDNFSTGWLHEARQVENVNVLVTNTQLVPALCKCLIYQLDAFFPIDRVYSSAKVRKYRCFEAIMKKYDAPDAEFVAIGDGLEEEQVSLALGLEFHKIRSLVDLKRLRYDLQLVKANSSSSNSAVVDTPAVAAAQMPVASSPVGQTAVV
ncbi:eyes absent family protein [Phytophthora infestans T30-4]|uniref:protein-tyrosine-phosphatase n=1 Tax=Phytophthora infestans (strain T30-4) TaxID=403677 RepID=D0MQA0_PHYIT|nr:eyes absent family protein [Phytophthora infestans T30-4]EEY57669.1 eyes absent family protein [Phytophthora infestans T30-4]|eukprot:XP_002908855.1 eyes absent family protein [Phytophthora infestans T30-4]